MKITFMLTWANAMGGTERAVFTQAEYLAKSHDVEVLSIFRTNKQPFFGDNVPIRYLVDDTGPVPRPARDHDLDDETCRVLSESPSRLIQKSWEGAFTRLTDLELERALRTLDTDVLVATTPALMAVATTLPPTRTVVVAQEHRASEYRHLTGEPLFQFAPRLDALVVLSERTREWFDEALGDCAPAVRVIPNALPTGFRPRSTRRNKIVTMAARLTPEKQVDQALEAFALVVAEHPEWTLRIFGDGPQIHRLRRTVLALELQDNVLLPGPTADIAAEWAKASMAILTSRSEAFGLTLAEAFAAGVPAVTYDSPTGPGEIVTDGENGFLIGLDDIEGLAAAISKLIADEALRDRLGEAALLSSARYSTEAVMPQWERLYAELVATRDDPGRVARAIERTERWTARSGGSGFAPVKEPAAARTRGAAGLEARILKARPELVRTSGRVCRITDRLLPAEVAQANLDLVVDALTAAGVEHYVVRDEGYRHRVAVLAEDRPKALDALATSYAEAPVYAQLRQRQNGRIGTVALAAQLPAVATEAGGLRVFEQIVSSSRTLAYGPQDGCDLEFWEQEEGDDLRPLTVTVAGATVERRTMRPAPLQIGDRRYQGIAGLADVLVNDIDFPVDLVYTWVDGGDPEWLARKNAVLADLHQPAEDSAAASRFRDRGELRYALRSAEMYAPWIRHIYLVTDRQVPAWLDTSHPGVTVVDHREIFADAGSLPTFNSHAIETRLHQIDGLSEHFLYCNDDIFFARPVPPQLFFEPGGEAMYFMSPTAIPLSEPAETEPGNFAAAKNNRRLIREAFGHTLTRAFLHTPHALRRSTLADLTERFPADVARTAASRMRSHTDVSVASSLHHYVGMFTGRSARGSIKSTYVNVGDAAQHPKLTSLLTHRAMDVFCLNDAHDGEVAEAQQALVMHAFLEAYYPIASSYERGSVRNLARGA